MSEQDIDAHLCAGGTVVAASDRAARAVLAAFHRARRAEGREAWISPRVYEWQTFVRLAWQERTLDGRLILNAIQEQSLWERIIAESGHLAALLEGPRRNLAAMAMHAHALLCSHAPQFLDIKARTAWQQDSAAFSRWLSTFEEACRKQDVISLSRLPLELLSLLESDSEPRLELLLVGFDRLLPAQAALLESWGKWSNANPAEQPGTLHSFFATDQAQELSACAEWCRLQLNSAPHCRILVIAQDVQMRRGEFERTFLHHAASEPDFRVEFSLGVLLAQAAPVRSAHMLLRWLGGELAEYELDWLIASPYAASAAESAALQARMRALRTRGLQRTHWNLSTFLDRRLTAAPLPDLWVQRFSAAHAQLQILAQRQLTPTEWADTVPQLLEIIGWSSAAALTSAEFQVIRRWRQVLDSCASLGFDGRRISWQEFLSELLHAANQTLFAPESEDAPILIAGPAESAGLTADAIWFLGAHEDAWPARGDVHPLIPIEVQRRSQMPHSTPQFDWDLTHTITTRLVASAREVNFSYALQADGVDLRASRIAVEFAGMPQALPPDLKAPSRAGDITSPIDDLVAVPYRTPSTEEVSIHLRGGAALLTAQSQCAFKAFATRRLEARTWDPAEVALNPLERGQLLHDVLHSVWSGPPNGIRSSRDLRSIADLPQFVYPHVQAAMGKVPARIHEDMPPQYLELEATRLTRLIAEWLAYEQSRVEFTVVGTEIDKTLTIAGLSLDLRLDRLDRLNDGSLLVIDYKTGDVSPKAWDLPRPEDVQLPLYAGFGIDPTEELGGLAFAKVRAGDMCFAGKIGDAAATLHSPKAPPSLVKYPLELDQLIAWRDAIEQLARDFLAGRADVNPLDVSKTCERCGLQTLCRINERTLMIDEEEAEPLHD